MAVFRGPENREVDPLCRQGRPEPDDPDETGAATAAGSQASASPLMTTREVCELFGRTPRTIRNWCRAGHLRPVRVGGAVFFRRDDVEALAGMRSG
jgi:excisionase family DNA binding protein